jgi:hypothetical protein
MKIVCLLLPDGSMKITPTHNILLGFFLKKMFVLIPELEPTTYHTWGEHANHYITDAVHNKQQNISLTLWNTNEQSEQISNHASSKYNIMIF